MGNIFSERIKTMTYAAITGWGKCLPPGILTNEDLATFLETDDQWIISRTGIKERRISHVPLTDLAYVASCRALACAGLAAKDLQMIVVGTCTYDEQVPNSSSGLQYKLGAAQASAIDINTACTSFLYGLSAATAMIRTGVVRNALVVGVEVISPYMDWTNRNVAVLFGDGAAAVVLQDADLPEGLLGEHLGCYADARQTLRVRGAGALYVNKGLVYGNTVWDFDGQEIFKKAVLGMAQASEQVLNKCGLSIADLDLVVPHQANLRIIEAVAKRTGTPTGKVFLTVQKYGNMSAATVPVALVEAVEEGRITPNDLILMPAFGGGLTLCAHLIRWGQRVEPLGTSDIDLPPCSQSALEMVNELRKVKDPIERSTSALMDCRFAETP
jgi:3-oxoacyl-[acyl-carrier-protein] synthase-3